MTLVYTVQNHIHLGVYGSSLSAYNEPQLKLEHVQKRAPHYEMTTSFNRSRTGNAAWHVLKSDTLAPLVFQDFEYELRVNDAELQSLIALSGYPVALIDNRHCPELTDHSPYIRKMAFMSPVYDSNLDPMLSYNIVTIMLKDIFTRDML